MARVEISGGFVEVDEEDVDLVRRHTWFVRTWRGKSYAMRGIQEGHGAKHRRVRHVRMHRELVGAPAGMGVDHINGDGLDNRRSNLRLATQQLNNYNQRLLRSNTSGHKGVSWHKQNGMWRVAVCANRKQHHGGLFRRLEDAVQAARALRERLHGEFVRHG